MSRARTSESERPDLALLIPSYAGGGGERVALFIARNLAQTGIKVDLVVARRAGELREEWLCGARRVELDALNEMLAARRWIRYLRHARPKCAMSMIHSANFNSGIGALFVRDVPVIVNLRIALDCHPAAQWSLRRRFGFGPERILYRRAARIVGASKGIAEEAVELLRVPADKVLAIPNPRAAGESRGIIAAEHEPFFDRPVVLGVGRLTPQKNFAMLLAAFAEVARDRDLHLVLLGEGPERNALLQEAAALGIQDRLFLPASLRIR